MSIPDRIVTTDRPNFRARIVHDEQPHEPEFYAGCPTFRLDGRYEKTAEYVYGQDDDDLRNALNRFLRQYGTSDGIATFDRWLRIFHEGNAQTITHSYFQSGPEYVTCITRAIFREWGNADDVPVPKAEADEWQSYIDGDCYGIVVEERTTTYTVTLDADDNVVDHDQDDDWREVDAVWGYYGDPDDESGKYILDSAREAIANAPSLAVPPAST